MTEQHGPPEEGFWDDDPADYPALCCHRCAGTGELTDDYDRDRTCPDCDGTGWPIDCDPIEGTEQ